ncbi:MAG: alanine racemase, partial [Verrucomicrobiota bacterium]
MPAPNDTTQLRTWAEINLAALRHNVDVAADILQNGSQPRSTLVAVIKANAYGHGAPQIAQAIHDHPGVHMLAVASTAEALELIDAGITNTPIHHLGPPPPPHMPPHGPKSPGAPPANPQPNPTPKHPPP